MGKFRNVIIKKEVAHALKSFRSTEKAAIYLGLSFIQLTNKIRVFELFGLVKTQKESEVPIPEKAREWDKAYNDKFKTYDKENIIQTVGPVLLPWER